MSAELRHLRAFVAAAEALSFSAAAPKLFVSQQSLSRTIAQLEQHLGVALFERTTRAISLTAAGMVLLPEARRLLEDAERTFDAARHAARGTITPLRVDISSGGIETGALILRRLRADRPDLPIEQAETGLRRGIGELRAGRLDVVLGLAGDGPEDLRSELVRTEDVLLGMAIEHPLAALDRVPVAALAGVELLLPADEAAGEWNEFVQGFCAQAGVTPRRFSGVTHGSVAAAEVVREGGCVVPTTAWTDPPAGLAFRRLVEPTPRFPWALIWRSQDDGRGEIAAIRAATEAVRQEHRWTTARP